MSDLLQHSLQERRYVIVKKWWYGNKNNLYSILCPTPTKILLHLFVIVHIFTVSINSALSP